MIMAKVLIIGAGGVGNVVVKKCLQLPEVFTEILLASRTLSKCQAIQKETGNKISVAKVDADKPEEVVRVIQEFRPDLVVNVALPYQDLSIMEACLQTKVAYLDTANYEPPEEAKFCYKWQWDLHEKFKEKGILALLGSGFDPGVTNVYCAYAQKHLFDEIHYIDILDCNAGDHGKAFATNFNPEINIREVTQPGKYWENGKWIVTKPILDENAIRFMFDYPVAGPKNSFLIYHEEMESLVKHIKGLKRIRFFMTFGEQYLTHLRVLQNVGMTRIDPVKYEGHDVVPLKFLKEVLPDPGSLGKGYKGKTVIGCVFRGIKDGKERQVYIYNICDHAECFKEVGAQAVSYTTGVPAMIGAKMILTGKWNGKGVFNMEQFDPDPFMDDLNKYGLPWKQEEFKGKLLD